MRPFYMAVLAVGTYLAVGVPMINLALAPDAFVASMLVGAPGEWEITLD